VIVLTEVPPLFARLVDDAAVFPPGNAPLPDAISGHRHHRGAWYQTLVGALLLPPDQMTAARALLRPGEQIPVGVVGEFAAVSRALLSSPGAGENEPEPAPATMPAEPGGARLRIEQIEVPVAKRQQDPQPGLRALVQLGRQFAELDVYAEIPLTTGLLGALDTVAEARAGGARVAPKFRTGGLAAELFPTPVELAAVICACRDRELPFKLTAGLHHALRHSDAETGFVHHGFLNVLAGTLAAASGAEVHDVASYLGGTDPVPLIEEIRPRRAEYRPLWIGFGSCSVPEPLDDLRRLGLLNRVR
jgi:hypothetical protein